MTTTTATGGGTRAYPVIALVAIAHGTSHVMQMAIPPLFLILRDEFGVSFTELGLLVTLLYGASGVAQTPAGVLVDRYDGHILLVSGLALLSACIALSGLVPEFWMLLPLALLAGIGNSVFHPADLTILSHKVEEKRLGRAYAAHTISGFIGYASVPAIVTALAAFGGWRMALVTVGLAGLALAALLLIKRPMFVYEKRPPKLAAAGAKPAGSMMALLASPVILTAFAYFALTAFAGVGVQAFSITAMKVGYEVPLEIATATLTIYFAGTTCGVLAGGWLAERAQRHERMVMGGVAVAAMLWLLMTYLAAYPWFVFPAVFVAGACYGATSPARDVLVRRAASGAGLGGTFGFVYSGFDLGSLSAPLLFGMLLDHGAPHLVFVGIAVIFALAIPTILEVRRRIAVPRPASAAAD
jgi:MFS family permease